MVKSSLIAGIPKTTGIASQMFNQVKEDKLLRIKTTFTYNIYVSKDGNKFHQTDWVHQHSLNNQDVKCKIKDKVFDWTMLPYLWFESIIIVKSAIISDIATGKIYKTLSWYEEITPVKFNTVPRVKITVDKIVTDNILTVINSRNWTIVKTTVEDEGVDIPVGDYINMYNSIRKTNRFDINPKDKVVKNTVIQCVNGTILNPVEYYVE